MFVDLAGRDGLSIYERYNISMVLSAMKRASTLNKFDNKNLT